MKRFDWDHNIELNIFQIFHNGSFFRPLQIYIGTGEYLKFGVEILGLEARWYWGGALIIYWGVGAGWNIDFLWLKKPLIDWFFGDR